MTGLRRLVTVYNGLVRAELQAATAYRAQLLIGLLGWVVPFVMMALWRTAAGDGAVAGITADQFTTYFVVVLVMTTVKPTATLVFGFSDLVHTGRLSALLLRPHHPMHVLVARSLAENAYRAGPVLAVAALAVTVGGGDIRLEAAPLLLAVAVGVVGCVAAAYVSALVGAVSLWVTKADGVQGLLFGMDWVLGGLVAPVALLPWFLPDIVRHQPLWYAIGAPAELVSGMASTATGVAALVEGGIWVVALHLLFTAVWRRGMRRYEAVGT